LLRVRGIDGPGEGIDEHLRPFSFGPCVVRQSKSVPGNDVSRLTKISSYGSFRLVFGGESFPELSALLFPAVGPLLFQTKRGCSVLHGDRLATKHQPNAQ
jgi:hypothetical protein